MDWAWRRGFGPGAGAVAVVEGAAAAVVAVDIVGDISVPYEERRMEEGRAGGDSILRAQ